MLTIFWESLSGVLVILIMVVCGFVMNERHWFSPQSPQIISKVVTQVALPTYMIATITKQFTTDQLKTLLPDLRYPVISMLILFALSFAVARALAIQKSHLGLFSSMFFNSNTVFIGLPINMALFGAALGSLRAGLLHGQHDLLLDAWGVVDSARRGARSQNQR